MKNIDFSEKTRQDLKALGVGVVYFFGSRVNGQNLDISDYDIGVVFVDKKIIEHSMGNYLKVYDILSNEIPDVINGPKLDISFLQKANPVLQIKAINEGRVLFEINPIFRLDYEESVIRIYNDYLFIKKDFEEATLRAFS